MTTADYSRVPADDWWHSGISRSVFLCTVPDVRLADLSVVAG